jgi:GT2 family glycosyltransferase
MERCAIAVLMACHNRKQKTLASLSALFAQEVPEQVQLTVYLVDDGSTDGTSEAVQQDYPQVKLLRGDGNLFWNRATHWAFSEAMQQDYDYYLWLNDDTVLYSNAVSQLLDTSQTLDVEGKQEAIVVGSICDPDTKQQTYGGLVRNSYWHPFKYCLLAPKDEHQPCNTMNGNCVLIPRLVAQKVGNLDPAFSHSIGDIDYGLRAVNQSCSVWLSAGYIGECKVNLPNQKGWRFGSVTLRERWKIVNQPKGLPFQERKVFTSRHAGTFWMIYWLLPYVRLLLIHLLMSFKKQSNNGSTLYAEK